MKWDNLYFTIKTDMFNVVTMSYPTGEDYKKRDTIDCKSIAAAKDIKRNMTRSILLDLAKRFQRGYEHAITTYTQQSAVALNLNAELKLGIAVAEGAQHDRFALVYDRCVLARIGTCKRGPQSKFHQSDKNYQLYLMKLNEPFLAECLKVFEPQS
jgi:hypothetical protein